MVSSLGSCLVPSLRKILLQGPPTGTMWNYLSGDSGQLLKLASNFVNEKASFPQPSKGAHPLQASFSRKHGVLAVGGCPELKIWGPTTH